LNSGRQRSSCRGMMDRLIRLLFAIVIGTTLIGAPVAQAAIAMPCDTTVADATIHQLSSGHAPTSIPCKEKMPGCADMLGCGFNASLYVRTAMTTDRQIWTQAAYWPVADLLEGLFVKPDLGPPITI